VLRRQARDERRLAAIDPAEGPRSHARHGGIGEQARERRNGFAIADPSGGERAPRPRRRVWFREQGSRSWIRGASDLRRESDVLGADTLRRFRRGRAAKENGAAEERRRADYGSQSGPLQVARRADANAAEAAS
jgi:hypothetical protein